MRIHCSKPVPIGADAASLPPSGAARRTHRADSSCSIFSSEQNKVVSSPQHAGPELVGDDVCRLVRRGITLEESPSTQSEAINGLFEGSRHGSMHRRAHINLGTLYYKRQEYALAERATRAPRFQIDPRYALAYFDLGNVLDEN